MEREGVLYRGSDNLKSMNEHKSTAPDFFLNLGVVVTLYTVVISFLNLSFDIINKLFPETLGYYSSDYYSSGVRMSIACLIIIFPLFVWLSHIVTKAMKVDPSRRETSVRRWLVYITLFLSAATIVTDLVILLNTFLEGEISTRFILKVVAVLIVGGIVFWHYLSEVRGTGSEKKYVVTLYGSSALVLALVVYAFTVFGSPATIRKQRMDDTRVQNLQAIQYQILNYWQLKGALPVKLADLNDSMSDFTVPVDPVTNQEYGYATKGKLGFSLCAQFSINNSEEDGKVQYNNGYAYPGKAFGVGGDVWQHTMGKSCFDRTIDPDLYPATKAVPVRGF